MAAVVKALNAKIRSHPVLDYVCSTRTYHSPRSLPSATTETGQPHDTDRMNPLGTPDSIEPQDTPQWNTDSTLINAAADFWGPVSNFGIPLAAVMDTQKDPDMYDLYTPIDSSPGKTPQPQ